MHLTPPPGPDLSKYRFTQLGSGQTQERGPAWSPDGESIAYAADVHGIGQIFARGIGSPKATQLTDASDWCGAPNSEIAVAYSLLFETCRRRAVASAKWKGRRVPGLWLSCPQRNPSRTPFASPPPVTHRATPPPRSKQASAGKSSTESPSPPCYSRSGMGDCALSLASGIPDDPQASRKNALGAMNPSVKMGFVIFGSI